STCSGLPLRLVEANSSSCFSLIDSYMSRDAPLRSLFFASPRLAESAAPAAFCCAFDLAGMTHLLLQLRHPNAGEGKMFGRSLMAERAAKPATARRRPANPAGTGRVRRGWKRRPATRRDLRHQADTRPRCRGTWRASP